MYLYINGECLRGLYKPAFIPTYITFKEVTRLTKRRLNEKQIAAIEYLSVPKRGGLTYDEIANRVGISRSTLSEWRKDDGFNKALNKRIIQRTQDHMPDVFDAAIKGITEDRNAAIFRTFLQAHGLLTDKVEVETNKDSVDIDAMKAKIEQYRKSDVSDS